MTGHVGMDCHPEHSTLLTCEEESLMMYIVQVADVGFGLSREDVMHTAFTKAGKSGRKHPFKSGSASRAWLDGFMRHFPRLTL